MDCRHDSSDAAPLRGAGGRGDLIPAATALGSSSQLSVIEDDVHLQADPAGTLEQMRALGADVVRVSMPWQMITPNPNSKRAPRRLRRVGPGGVSGGEMEGCGTRS